MQEVVALQELVGELCERHPLARFARQTFLNGVLGHHIVDGKVLADVAYEIEECVILHPVIVVDQDGRIRGVAVEIEKTRELLLYCLLVVAQSFHIEEFTLLAFHRWVADHAGSTTHEGDWFMTGTLEMLQHHHTHKVADMEGVGSRVDTEIGCRHPLFKLFICARHHLVNHAAPGKFFYKIHF